MGLAEVADITDIADILPQIAVDCGGIWQIVMDCGGKRQIVMEGVTGYVP